MALGLSGVGHLCVFSGEVSVPVSHPFFELNGLTRSEDVVRTLQLGKRHCRCLRWHQALGHLTQLSLASGDSYVSAEQARGLLCGNPVTCLWHETNLKVLTPLHKKSSVLFCTFPKDNDFSYTEMNYIFSSFNLL